jgi:hypothetical protein
MASCSAKAVPERMQLDDYATNQGVCAETHMPLFILGHKDILSQSKERTVASHWYSNAYQIKLEELDARTRL